MNWKIAAVFIFGFATGVLSIAGYLKYGEWHGKYQSTEELAHHVLELSNLQRALSEGGVSDVEHKIICSILVSAHEVSLRAVQQGVENWQVVELAVNSANQLNVNYPEVSKRCGI